MTPQQKAKELVESYMKVSVEYGYVVESGEGIGEDVYDSKTLSLGEAKECALIAVDLRLDADFNEIDIIYGESSGAYWQQVKTEIPLVTL